jgi:hypothetical protein
MRRLTEDLFRGAELNQAARVHDGDAVRHLRDYREIVRDKKHGESKLLPQLVEQIEHLRLDGDIQGGSGFVGDQQLWAIHDGHGDHHALALASRELMRIIASAAVRIRNRNRTKGFDRVPPGFTLGNARRLAAGLLFAGAAGGGGMRAHCLGYLVADAHHGIKRRHRLLKDHADAGSANAAHRGFGEREQVLAAKLDAAAHTRLGRQQAQDGQRGHRLARPGFSDESKDLSWRDGEAHVAHGTNTALRGREFHREILDLKQGCHVAIVAGETAVQSGDATSAAEAIMRKVIVLCLLLIASCSFGFAQAQIDAATKQDVEDMMQLTGVRDRMPLLYSAMASQLASDFADLYRKQHPNANPAEVQKAVTDATSRFQAILKVVSTDELIDAMIPVYQNYFTHSDIKAINEFYESPTGQKMLKNMNAMMIESMQAAMSVMKKHRPEIQAQIEKAAADESQPTSPQPK